MAFYFYCISRAVAADNSFWTPKNARRQYRENRHTDRQTHTQNDYFNPRCAIVKKTSTRTASTPRHPYLINNITPRPVIHPVVFNHLDGASIRTAALHTSGSAGSLGIDSTGWRCLCTSFHNASADFCNSLASVARKLCTTYVDPQG